MPSRYCSASNHLRNRYGWLREKTADFQFPFSPKNPRPIWREYFPRNSAEIGKITQNGTPRFYGVTTRPTPTGPKCEAYRPSCHYTTDGCGAPTCGWCSVRVSECQFFRGNPRNSHFPRKNEKIPKLGFRKIFLISQRHP